MTGQHRSSDRLHLSKLAQSYPKAIGRVQTLFLYVKLPLTAVKIVIVKAREHMKMEVPNVLIPSRSIVLTRGDAFAAKRLSHGVRQATRSLKELRAKLIWDVQRVFEVKPRCDQTVADYAGVMVKRNERKYALLHQDDSRLWSCSRQRLRDAAERTSVSGRRVLHAA